MLILQLCLIYVKKLNKTADEVLEIYNKKSGMLGISGISSDSRDIENALLNEGNERVLCY